MAMPRKILIIEDNANNRLLLSDILSFHGYEIALAADGQEGVTLAGELMPDLILMDIQMPGMDGLETTRRLRALQATGELRRFPIIALTAHAMASDRQASLDAGLDEHLTKPVHLDTLRSVLGQWLATPG